MSDRSNPLQIKFAQVYPILDLKGNLFLVSKTIDQGYCDEQACHIKKDKIVHVNDLAI